jgi:hypothetical protein
MTTSWHAPERIGGESHRCTYRNRRAADDHVESAAGHDAVELGEPVEGMVAFSPLFVELRLISIHAVLACQEAGKLGTFHSAPT